MKHKAKMLGSIRSILIALGGFAVGSGHIDENTMLQIVGGIMALTGAVWSLIDPAKNIGEGDPG